MNKGLQRWKPWAVRALLLLTLAFYALCFVHLRADFPNGSPWNDWSKTTDEGWYAGGAIHSYAFGRWIEPGAFNPVVAMPVWSVLAGAWFHIAGFGIVPLRVLTLLIYGGSLLLLWKLVRDGCGSLVAAAAVFLVAVNPFSYSFYRLAILEPLLIFLLLLAWLLAARCVRGTAWSVALGLTVAALPFTKTTGAVLIPAIFFHLWASNRQRWQQSTMVAVATAGSAWVVYFLAVIRPHLADYRLLFLINPDRVHLSIIPRVAWLTLRDGAWINPTLFPLACLCLFASAVWMRGLWRVPLFGSAALAGAGYLAFIGYHTNLQPRYYLVCMPAVVIVVVLTVHAVGRRALAPTGGNALRFVCMWSGLLLGITALVMAAQTVVYAMHPTYSFATAMDGMGRMIRSASGSKPFVIANSGDDLSLFTGVPAIAEQYSTEAPSLLLSRYQPGWYAVIVGGKPTPMSQALRSSFLLQERARYEIFDDPDRHTFVLYRLVAR